MQRASRAHPLRSPPHGLGEHHNPDRPVAAGRPDITPVRPGWPSAAAHGRTGVAFLPSHYGSWIAVGGVLRIGDASFVPPSDARRSGRPVTWRPWGLHRFTSTTTSPRPDQAHTRYWDDPTTIKNLTEIITGTGQPPLKPPPLEHDPRMHLFPWIPKQPMIPLP